MRGLVGEVPFDRDMERQVHAGNAGGSLVQDAMSDAENMSDAESMTRKRVDV